MAPSRKRAVSKTTANIVFKKEERGHPLLSSLAWRDAVEKDGRQLEHAPLALLHDRRTVMKAVKQHGPALQWASSGFRRDPGVVIAALQQDGRALQYAAKAMREDPAVVLEATRQQYGQPLQFATADFFRREGEDMEAVFDMASGRTRWLAAVARDGTTLRHAPREFRQDREVVTVAVSQRGAALEHAARELAGDSAVVLQAVRQEGCSLQFASPDLRASRDVVLEAVKQDGLALEFASQELKDDQGIVKEAVEQDGRSLRFASLRFRRNMQFAKRAMKRGRGTEWWQSAARPVDGGDASPGSQGASCHDSVGLRDSPRAAEQRVEC